MDFVKDGTFNFFRGTHRLKIDTVDTIIKKLELLSNSAIYKKNCCCHSGYLLDLTFA